MDMRKVKGFTLIELLIVIAITGIIASVVLVSLGDAKNKASFAAHRKQMKSIASAAAICVYSGGNLINGYSAAGSNICDLGMSYGVFPPHPGKCRAENYAIAYNPAYPYSWVITGRCIIGLNYIRVSCNENGCNDI